jgi:hypothetical protein
MAIPSMLGTITGQDGRYFVVECPDAPEHLRRLDLVKGQLCGGVVGDRVRLAYQTTYSRGLWNVVEVLLRTPVAFTVAELEALEGAVQFRISELNSSPADEALLAKVEKMLAVARA